MLLDIAIASVAVVIAIGAILTSWELWRGIRQTDLRIPQIGFALLLIAIATEGLLVLLQNRASETRIEAISPRDLSAETGARISDACKNFSGRAVVVASLSSDPEAFRLATQIAAALAKGGFQIVDRRGNYFPLGSMAFGITVRAQSSDVDFADCVNDALENIGKLAVTHDSDIAADGTPLEIVVNVKPLAD